MNFVNTSNNSFGNGYFDGFSIVGGHEYAETITDPFPSTGWLDSSGAENGDKCAWISSGQGAAANISLGVNSFAVQSLWSNALNVGAGRLRPVSY
jgi:serine protease